MKLNISKTKVIFFSRKTNILIYDYKLFQSSITRTDSIKDLEIFIDIKLHFDNHIDHIFSHCIKLLGLVRSSTFTFSFLNVCTDYTSIRLVRSNLEYASFVWNSVTSTDDNKLERIQQRFEPLCFNSFSQAHYCYSLALDKLKLHILHMRKHRLNTIFLNQVYLGSNFCPSVYEIVSFRVPALYIRDFALFNVCSCKNCPSARCASAASVVCKDVDLFGAKKLLLNNILYVIIVITIIIIIIIIINCLILYFVSFCCFFVRIGGNFLIGLWAVKFTS
jgi:hypothetical protein